MGLLAPDEEKTMSAVARSREGTRASHVIAAAFVAGALIGMVPGLLGVIMIWGNDLSPSGLMASVRSMLPMTALMAPILGIAAVILIAPAHLLAMRFLAPHWPRLARWVYSAPTVLVAYLLHMSLSSLGSEPEPNFGAQELVVMLAFAAPGALAFHLAVNRKLQPSGGWLLAVLAVVWLAVYVAALFGTPTTQRLSFSPLATRDHVLVVWHQTGGSAMFLTGLAAYVIWQFRMPRMAVGSLIAGIAVPLAFVGWYFSVPLGDGYAHFKLGERTVLIDWRREPYTYDGGLNFNIGDLEPYRIAGRHAINKTLRVQPVVGSLHNQRGYGDLPNASREQWGLSCHEISIRDRPGSVCGQPGSPQQWTTRVWVGKGYAFHSFDHDGIRYSLHYDVEDVRNWRDIERAVIGVRIPT